MAEPPQDEHITIMNTTEQTPTGDISPHNDSVVEISDDSTNKSTTSTSREPSSAVEVVEDDSKKRKSTDHEQATPAKKQKQLPTDGTEDNAKDAEEKEDDSGSGSKTATKEKTNESQQASATASQAGSQSQKHQYDSIEELREKANGMIKAKNAEIKELKARVETVESVRDKWQMKVARAEIKVKQAEDTREAQDKAMFKKAQDWKKQELERQVVGIKEKYEKDLEKAKNSMQNKLEKEEEKVESLKEKESDLRKKVADLKEQVKNGKPGNSKELKEKVKELESCQNLLEAQQTNNDMLAQRLMNRGDDLERIRGERLDLHRKAQAYHKAWEKQVKENDKLKENHGQLIDDLKAEHAEDMQKQYEMWHIQAANSHENQVRLVGRQRGLFELNNAHDRVIQECSQYKKMLKAANAEIERLKSAAAPQQPRPAPALPTPSENIRPKTCRLQEPQTQDTIQKVNSRAESSRPVPIPEAEVTHQHEAAETRAKTEVDATVDNDRQVTQIIKDIVNDAQQPQGEPHSETTGSSIENEATGDVEIDGMTREVGGSAAEVQSQDMHATSEDAGHVEEDEANTVAPGDQMQDMQASNQVAGPIEEDEAFAEPSDDQMQAIQTAQQGADQVENSAAFADDTGGQTQGTQTAHEDTGRAEDESFAEATEDQMQAMVNMQARNQGADPVETEGAFAEAPGGQMQDVQTTLENDGRAEEDVTSQMDTGSDRGTPDSGSRRGGLFSFNLFGSGKPA